MNYMPKQATLYMTERCNFLCKGCSRQSVDMENFKDISLDVVKKALELYPDLHGFCLAGLGEPALNPNVVAIVDYLKNNGKYVGVISNGSFIDPYLAMEHRPDYISISLYGYNRQQYNEYVGLDMFDTVMENYHTLKQKGFNVGFSYFVSKDNYKNLGSIISMADGLGADFINITNYLVYDPENREELDKIIYDSDKEIIEYIENELNKSSRIKARPMYLNTDFAFFCPSYRNIINIDGDGNIGGCQRQKAPSKKYGNLFDSEDPYNIGEMKELCSLISKAEYPHGDNCKYCFGKMNPDKANTLDIGVYILFYEKVDQTIECLQSFLPFDIPIYVLNNGSSKKSVEALESFTNNFSNIRIIHSEKNLGVGVGRNKLIHETTHEWMFFIDNDITINTYNFLSVLYTEIRNNPSIEAFMPRLFNKHDDMYLKHPQMKMQDKSVWIDRAKGAETNMFPGGAAVIRRTMFERLGFYDKQMFVGLEDFEMALRSIILKDEIKGLCIDTIELIHDHRVAVSMEDKTAVLERYNFTELDKSYYRILDKFPEINFQMEFRPWVVEQVDKILGSNVDLKMLNSEYDFGADRSIKHPNLIDVNYQYETLSRIDGIDFIFSFHEVEGKIKCGKNVVSGDYSQKSGGSIPLDYCDYDSIQEFKSKYIDDRKISRIVVISILELVEDIRPFLRFIRSVANDNPEMEIIYVNDDQLNNELVNNGYCYYYWNEQSLKKLLVSSGLIIKEHPLSSTEKNLVLNISSTEEFYSVFLRTNFLPENKKFLVVTQEHAKAKITGGIGSYVYELENLIGSDLMVLIVAAPDLYPERSISMESRHITPTLFFKKEDSGYERAPDIIKQCLDIIVFLYDNLRLVEMQDVDGKAYKALQASKVGLYPSNIKFATLCHASKISLENLFGNWIGFKETALFEEKYIIENSDSVVFPTKYLYKFYEENGYNIDYEKIKYCRLPFTFAGSEIKDRFSDIDTLIFFGKRQEYKGYIVFAEMVRYLMENESFRKQIKNIILLGPKNDSMSKYNEFFNSLVIHNINVEEYSLKRQDALDLIHKYSDRAICYTPYIGDNHPNSVLEVINSGCLLLASLNGGIPELVPADYHSKMLCSTTKYSMAKMTLEWLGRSAEERHSFTSGLKAEVSAAQVQINQDVKDRFYSLAESERVFEVKENPEKIIVYFNAENYTDVENVLRMISYQIKQPDKIICLYSGQDIVKIGEIFSSIQVVVSDTQLFSLLDPDSVAVFINSRMKINKYFISKLIKALSMNECDGVIFNSVDETGVKTNYIGDGVFYFSIKNIVGHPYGAFYAKSIINLDSLSFESIWHIRSFITNFISSKRHLVVYPSHDVELEQVKLSTFKEEFEVAQSIKSLSRFGIMRANAAIFQLKEMERKYLDLLAKYNKSQEK